MNWVVHLVQVLRKTFDAGLTILTAMIFVRVAK